MKYFDTYNYFNSIVPIPANQWREIETMFEEVVVEKGDLLIKEGQESINSYIVIDGLMKASYTDGDGKEHVKNFFKTFDIAAPYFEQKKGIPSRTSIKALERTTLATIGYDQMQQVFRSSTSFALLALSQMESIFLNKEQREYEFLILDAEQRYLNFIEENKSLVHRLHQYDIASHLGILPTSLSRILKKIKSDDKL